MFLTHADACQSPCRRQALIFRPVLLSPLLPRGWTSVLALTVLLGMTGACSASNIVVVSTGSSGAGSLRQAISDANPGDTISFDSSVTGTISTGGTEIAVNKNLTITGPGPSTLAISAGSSGRVFHITAGTISLSSLRVTDGNITTGTGGNTGKGAGMLAEGGTSVTLSNVVVDHNTSVADGAGIYTDGALILLNCTFDTNHTTLGGGGGGIYVNGALSATGCTFTGNSGVNGGAIFAFSAASLTNCTLTNNTVTAGSVGGGIVTGGVASLTNCTITGNSAAANGGAGGGAAAGGGSTMTLTACLITGNAGGDLFKISPPPFMFPPMPGGTIISGGSNLVGDADGNGITNGTSHDQTGVSLVTANLGALASNGGPTQTCTVQTGSPAISGDYALATSVDQRGFARTVTQHTIGAYEAGAGAPLTLTSIALTPTPIVLTVGTPLVLTLTATYSDSSTANVTSQATWASLNPTVATVDSTGNITPHAPGTTYISVTFGGITITIPVTVTDPNAATGCDALWTRTDSEFSIWEFPQGGGFSNHDFDAISGYTARSFALTPNGHAHILLTASDGTASLNDALVAGLPHTHNAGTQTTYGPYPGWTAQAVAAGPDGNLRLLWAGTGGTMSLWRVTGNISSHREYGPYPGWTPQFLSIAPDNTPRVLWTNTSGQAAFWVVNAVGVPQHFEFGPYGGWTPSALTTGPDGTSHLLWNHTSDGMISLWTITDAGRFVPTSAGPYTGWSASGLAVSGDDTLHLGWGGTGGTAAMWNMPGTNPLAFTHAEYGPFVDTGWTLKALSATP